MELSFLSQAAQLGGTVFTVVVFLWYLSRRDVHWNKSVDRWTEVVKNNSEAKVILARSLEKLSNMVERNSTVSVKNTNKIQENVEAVSENTAVIDKNTQVTAQNTNGNGVH